MNVTELLLTGSRYLNLEFEFQIQIVSKDAWFSRGLDNSLQSLLFWHSIFPPCVRWLKLLTIPGPFFFFRRTKTIRGPLGEGWILLFKPVCPQVELRCLCSNLIAERSTPHGLRRSSVDTTDLHPRRYEEQQLSSFTASLYSDPTVPGFEVSASKVSFVPNKLNQEVRPQVKAQ